MPRPTLRVLGVRDDEADQAPVLVVKDLRGSATSLARSTFSLVREDGYVGLDSWRSREWCPPLAVGWWRQLAALLAFAVRPAVSARS